jgi:hypothetical protein
VTSLPHEGSAGNCLAEISWMGADFRFFSLPVRHKSLNGKSRIFKIPQVETQEVQRRGNGTAGGIK